jgi:hypothetical protein
MKRITTIILAVILLFAACDNNMVGPSPAPFTFASADKIAQEIMAEIEIPAKVQKFIEDLPYFIPDLDTEKILELSYYICASGFQPDELLIIKFETNEKSTAAKAAVEARLETRKNDFRDYAPDEMYKLDSAVVYVYDRWLFFFVLEDNAKAKQIADSNK